ncbi:hypothetical protein RUM43_004128 [Polyplax serrata]|uniref:RanBP2-type domain-containing protein n=1 Tax=Polyplax serrata TaxID=468196 RepID=A0AAN8XMP4_POLSC
MLLVDSLKELRTLIDQQHLLYLEFDENPQKIEQRDKLETYIKEYLCLAPHSTKFTFQETADVLHQSASTKCNFSAYKAAVAWKAIGKYADNLISHPWRKEYRNIKLYCGFYKHEIEETLVGAEQMFEAMGYRHIGPSSLVLHGILDPDRITSVSKDAILAYVECQIMKQIWETLSTQFQISWLEILEFRENHIGSPDQVINSIIHKYSQRQYQEKVYHRQTQSLENHLPPQECLYRHNPVGFYSHSPYPTHSYSLPLQTRYTPIVSSPQVLPPSALYPTTIHPSCISPHNALKPQEMYAINGHHRHSHYPNSLPMPNYTPNGYSLESGMCQAPSIVPTGQLIEFDSAPTFNRNEAYFQKPNLLKYNSPQHELLHLQSVINNDEPSLSGKAKDDGAGSWENWDYVYRNLESHGYKKNLDSPGDMQLKGNQQSSQNTSSETDFDSVIQTELSDKLRKINLDRSIQGESSSSKSFSDINDDSKSKTTSEKAKADVEKNREHIKVKPENKQIKSNQMSKKEANSSSSENNPSNGVYSKVNVNQKKDIENKSKENVKPRKLRDDVKPLVVNLDDEEEEKWQCITCTYLNSIQNNICEMCCKSKERGHEINPQPTGGQECHKCTLVNKPGLTFCGACNAYLKDSPTYI